MNALRLRARHARRLLLTSGLAAGISMAVAAPPATVENAHATITIGDIHGLLDNVAKFANKAQPNITGDTLRGYLGVFLGDGGLSSLEPGDGLVLAFPRDGMPFMLLETADDKAETLGAAIRRRTGVVTSTVSGDLLAISPEQQGLEQTSATIGQAARSLLESSNDPTIRAVIDADQVVADRKDMIQQNVRRLGTKISDAKTTSAAKCLTLFANTILASAKRSDVVTIDVSFSAEDLRFDKRVYPVGGLNLGTAEGATGQELRKSVPPPQDALVDFEYQLDTATALQAIKPLITEALQESDVPAGQVGKINELIDRAGETYGDGMGGWVAHGSDGSQGAYLLTVNTPETAMNAIEAEIAESTAGPLANFYASMGLETTATLEKNVREIDSQPVHRFSMNMRKAGDSSGPGIYDIRQSMLTFVDNKLVMTLGNVSVENAVAVAKAGARPDAAELEARQQLPEGGFFYADYFPAHITADATGKPEIDEFMKKLEGITITEAGYVEADNLRFMASIPSELVARIARHIMEKRSQLRDPAPVVPGTVPRDSNQATTPTEPTP